MSAARRFGIRFWLAVAVASVMLGLSLAILLRRHENVVATLRSATGQVERDHRATVGAWNGASVGATFVVGDGLRTRARSTALIELSGAHELALEPNTLVRFLTRPTDERANVAIESGELTIVAGGEKLELETELGLLRLIAHGRARLTKARDTAQLIVSIGAATIEKDGKRWELSVGDAVEVLANGPLMKRLAGLTPADALPSASASASVGVGVGAPASPAPSPENATTTGGSGVTRFERGLDRVDVSIEAGESVVIHDPKPPTTVGVNAGKHCKSSALLSVDRGLPRAQDRAGEARIGVELAVGSHAYSVHCLEADGTRGRRVEEGTISVLLDSGMRRLAKTAPSTSVDADGRRYTVLYQSLLPRISVEWPNAPTASSYTINVGSRDGTKTVTTKGPSYDFAAGSLAEGEHVFSFQGGGARSRETTVVIRFDNAAPTASISSPANGSFAPGASVLVSGTAQPGWVVSVGAARLEQDSQNRFSMVVNAPTDEALAIRFAKPARGVHYYLRRNAL